MAAKLKCNLCGFESDDAVVFCSHILSAHSNIGETKVSEEQKEYVQQALKKCVICGSSFKDDFELAEHYKKEHPEEYKMALEYLGMSEDEDRENEVKEIGADENRGKPKEDKRRRRKKLEETSVSLDVVNASNDANVSAS